MSMQPRPWPEVPASTAKIAKRAFRKGSLAMRARDELGAWCQDEAFGAIYGTRGAPGVSPAQLAMVTVLQFTGDLWVPTTYGPEPQPLIGMWVRCHNLARA